jgi:hypothetical protein
MKFEIFTMFSRLKALRGTAVQGDLVITSQLIYSGVEQGRYNHFLSKKWIEPVLSR